MTKHADEPPFAESNRIKVRRKGADLQGEQTVESNFAMQSNFDTIDDRRIDSMLLLARIVGCALFVGVIGAWLGYELFQRYSDYAIPSLALACAGGIIGAIGGSAREIVMALRSRHSN
jgi:hypothetical protein